MTSVTIELSDEELAAMSAASDSASQTLPDWIASVCRERLAEDAVLRPGLPSTDAAARAVLLLPVTALGFSSRIINALRYRRIETVRDLVTELRADLLKVRNMGRTSVDQIESTLAKHGLRLGLPLPRRFTVE